MWDPYIVWLLPWIGRGHVATCLREVRRCEWLCGSRGLEDLEISAVFPYAVSDRCLVCLIYDDAWYLTVTLKQGEDVDEREDTEEPSAVDVVESSG